MQFFFLFCLSLSLWCVNQEASAALISSVDVNYGFTSVTLKTDTETTNLSSPTAIEANYVLKHPGLSLGYVMSFYEMMEGKGKKIPFSAFAIGFRYYPLGFNGQRLIVDQGVSAQVWKATPFIGLNMGIANISTDNYNASVIETSPRFGLEVPITATFLGQAQLILHSGSSTGSAATKISYDGITGLVGIVLVGL